MVDIKRGDEWEFQVSWADPDQEAAQRSRRLAAKSTARTNKSRVQRPAVIPHIPEPRSSFAVFEASMAVKIARARRDFMNRPTEAPLYQITRSR